MIDPVELLRDQPVDVPSRARIEEVRTELLARSIASAPSRRRWPFVVAAVVAAAASALLLLRGGDAARIARGHVHAHDHAVVDVDTTTPDEVARLSDGAIDVEVDPLAQGERFRVVVGASEIEVRGTAFTVTADHGKLVDVQVAHGRVEVRSPGEPLEVLGANESWRAKLAPPPVVVVQPPIAPVVVVEPPKKPRVAHIAASAAPAPVPEPAPVVHVDETSYNEAWTAMREKRYGAAAELFATALHQAPDGALADDARYWHAVALARAGQPAAAIDAFRALVDEHPGTLHRGEAAAMLGWLLVDQKRYPEAKVRFQAAATDPSDKVRASAESGLRALRH